MHIVFSGFTIWRIYVISNLAPQTAPEPPPQNDVRSTTMPRGEALIYNSPN